MNTISLDDTPKNVDSSCLSHVQGLEALVVVKLMKEGVKIEIFGGQR